MPEPPRRLGRGLSSLVSSHRASKLASQLDSAVVRTPAQSPRMASLGGGIASLLPIESILPNPSQPRRTISEEKIARLADSIRRSGVIQPILVRPAGRNVGNQQASQYSMRQSVKYELIAGERRWKAAKLAGLSDVPAIIREADDQQLLELALVENIQREDLNAIDRALAYQAFRKRFGLTAEEVGQRVGDDRTTVTNYLRLLELPTSIQELVAGNLISMGHARALLPVSNSNRQRELAESVVVKNLSVREVEEIVRRDRVGQPSGQDPPPQRLPKRPHIRDMERRFEERLHCKVTIQEGRRKNRGKIVIQFESLDDFDRICESMGLPT